METATESTSPRADLTPRQASILDWILDRMGEGRAPTAREAMLEFAIASPNGIQHHLRTLARKGYLCLSGGQPQHDGGIRRGPSRSLRPGPRLAGLTVAREAAPSGDVVVLRRDGVPVLRLAPGEAVGVAAQLLAAAKGG